MVALSLVSQRTSVLAGPRTVSAGEADGGFALALAALAGGDDNTPTGLPGRQDDAAAGKALPDIAADPAAPATLDPRLLWLPAGLLPSAPTPGGVASGKPASQLVAVAGAVVADPLTATATTTDAAPADPGSSKALAQLAVGDATLTAKIADLFRTAERATTTHIAAESVAIPPQPQPAPVATATISTELAALGLNPTAHDDRKKTAADPIVQPTTLTTEVALQNTVQPTGETRHVPLDLRGDTGLQAMIDHIETLRDGADANDTRIRLTPDALGAVDVAVRRDGDAVHVHFTAENAATRTLLTDAQPRLTELAEQRGVRIAGSSVETSTGSGSGGGHQPPPRPAASITNVSLPTPIDASGDDARLA